MPGRYGSRATKFLYLDGAAMTGADGPLTKSESETELLAEKFMPEGSSRPVCVQSGLVNETITLEGYARRDSGAANLILSDDAHALAATPERVLTTGDFGDIVGQTATIHHAVTLADSWKTIPGDILLQFSGTLKTALGGTSGVREGTIRPRDVSVNRRDREQRSDSSAIRRHGSGQRPLVSSWRITSRKSISGIARDSRWASRTRSPRPRTQRRSTRPTSSSIPKGLAPSLGRSDSGSKRVGRPDDSLVRPSPLVDLGPPPNTSVRYHVAVVRV